MYPYLTGSLRSQLAQEINISSSPFFCVQNKRRDTTLLHMKYTKRATGKRKVKDSLCMYPYLTRSLRSQFSPRKKYFPSLRYP